MQVIAAFLALLLATSVEAATLSTRSGTLASAQTGAAPFASTNDVDTTANLTSLWIRCSETGTTSWQIEHAPDGVTFSIVTEAGMQGALLDTYTFVDIERSVRVLAPAGRYRVSATVCTACTLTCHYLLGPEVQ
jgi:hypothetical protein